MATLDTALLLADALSPVPGLAAGTLVNSFVFTAGAGLRPQRRVRDHSDRRQRDMVLHGGKRPLVVCAAG